MPAFARKTTVKRQFGARRVPGGAIYVLYADKIQLKVNRQFDVYCRDCITRSFPKAIIV